jgi:small subunit ribosomal protein S8
LVSNGLRNYKEREKMTDPIADYLTRIRNAVMANHKVVEIPASNIKKEMTRILLQRISKPGLRKYVDSANIPRVLNGLGVAIISTSQGLMTDKEARSLKVGGEVLCYVY